MKTLQICLTLSTVLLTTFSLQSTYGNTNIDITPETAQQQTRFKPLATPDLLSNQEQKDMLNKARTVQFQTLEKEFKQSFTKPEHRMKRRHKPYNARLDNDEACLNGSGITRENVGDPESFGCPIRWAGLGQTDTIRITNGECVPDEFTRCLPASDNGAFATYDEQDVASIVLPPKTAKSLMCHSLSPLNFIQYANNTGASADSVFLFTPYVTIENAALDDPALINNRTGLPFNGSVESSFAAGSLKQRMLDAGENELDFSSYTRQCIAGFMSYNLLSGSYELSDEVIEDFFANETTLRIHIRGSHNLVADGNIRMGYRIYTD